MKWLGREKRRSLPFPVFDGHTHLLPGLDDGVTSWEEAVDLAREAWEAGTRVLALTPHFLPGVYDPSPDEVIRRAAELARRLNEYLPVRLLDLYAAAHAADRCPAGDPGGNAAAGQILWLLPGMEAHLVPELPDLLRRGRLLTLAGAGTHLLVELPFGELPGWSDEVLFSLALAGVTPVLAHPERCAGVRKNPDWATAAVERGALVQINGDSLLGGAGREAARTAAELVKRGLVHLLGSDAHSRARPAVLSEGAARLVRLAGEEAARKICSGEAAGLGLERVWACNGRNFHLRPRIL
jgi:protein-tyrosine phosphatase